MDEGSYGAGIVLGLFLDVIGLIIALCLGKKETIKGAIVGTIISIILCVVLLLAISCFAGIALELL